MLYENYINLINDLIPSPPHSLVYSVHAYVAHSHTHTRTQTHMYMCTNVVVYVHVISQACTFTYSGGRLTQ